MFGHTYLTLRNHSSLGHVLAMLLAGQSHSLFGRHGGRQELQRKYISQRPLRLTAERPKINERKHINKYLLFFLGQRKLTNASKYQCLGTTSLSSWIRTRSALANRLLYLAKQRTVKVKEAQTAPDMTYTQNWIT